MITFSSVAIGKIKSLINEQKQKPVGLRISLSTKGCSGLSWKLDFVDKVVETDDKLEIEGINVFIDPKAVIFIIGSSVDYIKTDLEEGFVFINPNEKGKCGCGESFTV